MLQRTLPAGIIAPCLPTKTDRLPSGSQWLHEIKHDGFRVIARKHGPRVRLYSRPGNDLTRRFPLIVDALARLRSRSCPSMAKRSLMLAKARPGIRFNEHIEGDGPTVFAHACKMGLEGIVSKRKDSAYRSGRSPDWLKKKNSAAPAVKREPEQDWAR
jgi:bifunctional non-homologous end joining protein LigD